MKRLSLLNAGITVFVLSVALHIVLICSGLSASEALAVVVPLYPVSFLGYYAFYRQRKEALRHFLSRVAAEDNKRDQESLGREMDAIIAAIKKRDMIEMEEARKAIQSSQGAQDIGSGCLEVCLKGCLTVAFIALVFILALYLLFVLIKLLWPLA